MRALVVGFFCLLAVWCAPHEAQAQAIVLPCVPSGTSCIPVSAANPLPTTGGVASSIVVGATVITGVCTNGYTIYDNNGFVGCQASAALPLSGANGGTGIANTGSTVTLGASVITTGAGVPTLAFPASSATYTFPTATATLSPVNTPNGINAEYGSCSWVSNVWTCGTTTNGGTARAYNIIVGGSTAINVDTSFNVNLAASSLITWSGQGGIRGSSATSLTVFDSSFSSFGRLQLGGTTSSFPAIKRNATAINFRLADDSGDTAITASTATFSALANTATTSAVCYNVGTGVLTYDGTLGTCTVSALWHKNLLGILDRTDDPLSMLRSIVYTYRYNNDGIGDDRIHVGLAADDVERMDSRCATYDTDGRISNYEDRCVLAYLVQDRAKLRAELNAIKQSVSR